MRTREKCWSIQEDRPITFTIEARGGGDVMLEFAPMQMKYDTFEYITTSIKGVCFSQYSYMDGSCRMRINKNCINVIENMLK